MRDRRPSHRLSLASIPLASPSSYLQPSSLSCLRRFASLAPTVAIPPSPLPTPFSLLPRSSQFLSLLLSVALWLSLLLPSASAGSALYFDSTPQLVQAIDALQVSQDGPLATGEVPSRFFSAVSPQSSPLPHRLARFASSLTNCVGVLVWCGVVGSVRCGSVREHD